MLTALFNLLATVFQTTQFVDFLRQLFAALGVGT